MQSKGAGQVKQPKVENFDAYDEIISERVTDEFMRKVQHVMETKYTTTTLTAIALILRDLDDEVGANMIAEFARNYFAVHEANTV
jgi:hypothetical protein